MEPSRSCREFVELYKDALVNCATCKLYDGKKCRDQERVVAAHEREFDEIDREMRGNKGVWVE